jgi:hypothetical protein
MRSSGRTSIASWRRAASPICVMWSCSAAGRRKAGPVGSLRRAHGLPAVTGKTMPTARMPLPVHVFRADRGGRLPRLAGSRCSCRNAAITTSVNVGAVIRTTDSEVCAQARSGVFGCRSRSAQSAHLGSGPIPLRLEGVCKGDGAPDHRDLWRGTETVWSVVGALTNKLREAEYQADQPDNAEFKLLRYFSLLLPKKVDGDRQILSPPPGKERECQQF